MDAAADKEVQAVLDAALSGTLTQAQVKHLANIDAELVKLALLAASQRIAEQNAAIAQLRARLHGATQPDPSTPSGQRPVYSKPPAPKRKGKPGAKKGHAGVRRPRPERIDRVGQHHPDRCPDCGSAMS